MHTDFTPFAAPHGLGGLHSDAYRLLANVAKRGRCDTRAPNLAARAERTSFGVSKEVYAQLVLQLAMHVCAQPGGKSGEAGHGIGRTPVGEAGGFLAQISPPRLADINRPEVVQQRGVCAAPAKEDDLCDSRNSAFLRGRAPSKCYGRLEARQWCRETQEPCPYEQGRDKCRPQRWLYPTGQRRGRMAASRPGAVAVSHLQRAPRHRVRVQHCHLVQQQSVTHAPG